MIDGSTWAGIIAGDAENMGGIVGDLPAENEGVLNASILVLGAGSYATRDFLAPYVITAFQNPDLKAGLLAAGGGFFIASAHHIAMSVQRPDQRRAMVFSDWHPFNGVARGFVQLLRPKNIAKTVVANLKNTAYSADSMVLIGGGLAAAEVAHHAVSGAVESVPRILAQAVESGFSYLPPDFVHWVSSLDQTTLVVGASVAALVVAAKPFVYLNENYPEYFRPAVACLLTAAGEKMLLDSTSTEVTTLALGTTAIATTGVVMRDWIPKTARVPVAGIAASSVALSWAMQPPELLARVSENIVHYASDPKAAFTFAACAVGGWVTSKIFDRIKSLGEAGPVSTDHVSKRKGGWRNWAAAALSLTGATFLMADRIGPDAGRPEPVVQSGGEAYPLYHDVTKDSVPSFRALQPAAPVETVISFDERLKQKVDAAMVRPETGCIYVDDNRSNAPHVLDECAQDVTNARRLLRLATGQDLLVNATQAADAYLRGPACVVLDAVKGHPEDERSLTRVLKKTMSAKELRIIMQNCERRRHDGLDGQIKEALRVAP